MIIPSFKLKIAISLLEAFFIKFLKLLNNLNTNDEIKEKVILNNKKYNE
jgi:hypothetical protein